MLGCIGAFILAMVVSFLGSLFFGWMFMLAVMFAHDQWWPVIPTIGYWPAVLVVMFLRAAITSVNWSDSK